MIMGSRVLGLIRDHYQAFFFGTGAVATAWEIAYMLPNMLRNLLAEGVLSQAFIPIYSEALGESEEQARRVAGVILGFLFLFLLALVVLAVSIFPLVLPYYAGQSLEDTTLLISLSQVLFVFIMTASLTAILAGVANAHMLFTIPALSPIVLNIVFIGGFLVIEPLGQGAAKNAEYLSGVVVLGGFAQLATQAIYIRYKGLWPNISFRFRDPVLKKIFSLMAPATLGAGLFQLNQLMDIAIAGFFIPGEEGAVPALRFAHRLVQLPTGIIGVALSTVILPSLAAKIREDTGGQNGTELISALSFSLFLTVPATLGLYMLGPRIIDLLFYGGAWGAKSTQATWWALQFYVWGVPLYSMNKILTAGFYAYQDTKTPVRVMLVVICINLSLNLLLVPYLYQGGLALATSFCALLTFLSLFKLLQNKLGTVPYNRFVRSIVRQAPLWLVCLAFLLVLEFFFKAQIEFMGARLAVFLSLPYAPRYTALLWLGIAIPGVLILYFGLAVLLGNEELRNLRRRRPDIAR